MSELQYNELGVCFQLEFPNIDPINWQSLNMELDLQSNFQIRNGHSNCRSHWESIFLILDFAVCNLGVLLSKSGKRKGIMQTNSRLIASSSGFVSRVSTLALCLRCILGLSWVMNHEASWKIPMATMWCRCRWWWMARQSTWWSVRLSGRDGRSHWELALSENGVYPPNHRVA